MAILAEKFGILKNPLTGFLAVLIVVVVFIYIVWLQEPVELSKVVVWYIGLGILLLLVVRRANVIYTRLPKQVIYILVALGLLLIISPWFSLDSLNTIFGIYPRYSNSVFFFISWLLAIFLVASFSDDVRTRLLKLFAWTGFIVALWGILQNFGIGYYAGITEAVRVTPPSFLGNPNFSAMFVVGILPLLIWFGVLAKTLFAKYAYFFAVAVSLVGIIFFNSRGAFLGLIVVLIGLIVLLTFLKKYWEALLLLIVSLIIVATSSVYFQASRIQTTVQQAGLSETAVVSRYLVWDVALASIKQQPWFGSGLGNFFLTFRANQHSALTDKEWFDDVHNIVLHLYASAGIPIATLMVLLIMLVMFWCGRHCVRERNGLSGVVFLSLLGFLVVGSFTPVGAVHWIFLAFLLVYGLSLYGQVRIYQLGYLSKAVIIIIGLVFIVLGSAILMGDFVYRQGKIALNKSDYQQAYNLSKLARQLTPLNDQAVLLVMRSAVDLEDYNKFQQAADYFVSLHPKSAGMYLSTASFYTELYNKTKSEEYRQLSIKDTALMLNYNNNYAPSYVLASINMVHVGAYELALMYAQKAVVLDPDQFHARIMWAKAHYGLGNYQETLFGLRKSYEIYHIPSLREAITALEQAGDLKSFEFPYQY